MYLSIIFEDFVAILKSWTVQAAIDVLILAFELCGQASVIRTRTGTGTGTVTRTATSSGGLILTLNRRQFLRLDS